MNKSTDIIVMTGIVDDKPVALILNLDSDGDYICQKLLWFKDGSQTTIHSIFCDDETVYLIDSFNSKVYSYQKSNGICSETSTGKDPRHMCTMKGNLYVTNFETDNISVVDRNTFTLIESIPAGIKPHDIYSDKLNNKLYISCYEENKILEYDIDSNAKVYYETEGKPMHLFVDGDYIFVLTYFVNGNVSSKINIINKVKNEIEYVVKINGFVSNVDYDYEQKLVYAINIEDRSLYIADIDKKTILKKIYIGGYPEDISFGKENIYVTDSKKNQILIIDREKHNVVKRVDLEFSPLLLKVVK